jgi:hypothetical protein
VATGDGSRLSGATLAPPMRTSGQEGPRFSGHGCEVSQQLDDFRGRRELIGGRELLVRDPTNSSSRACISPIASFRLVACCTDQFAPCGSGSSVGNHRVGWSTSRQLGIDQDHDLGADGASIALGLALHPPRAARDQS